MDGTLITPSFTSLYGQTEINPLHPTHLAGCDIGNTHTSIICRLYRAKVEDLHDMIDTIDVDAIIAEATR